MSIKPIGCCTQIQPENFNVALCLIFDKKSSSKLKHGNVISYGDKEFVVDKHNGVGDAVSIECLLFCDESCESWFGWFDNQKGKDIVGDKLCYPYTIHQEEVEGHSFWVAESPMLRGCVGQGDTHDDAIKELEKNEKVWIETAKKFNIEIPKI